MSGSRDCRYCYDNELILSKCSLEDEKVLGQNIVYLTVAVCQGLSQCFVDNFSRSSNPTSLKRLRIESCGEVECLLSNDEGTPFLFSTLEYIQLVDLVDLKGMVIQKGKIGAAPAHAVFSSLKRLEISKCNKLRKVGIPVSGVPNLEQIEIQECEEIEEIFEDEGKDLVTTLPKLQNLRLKELPRLRKVGLPISGVPNLEGIEISGCGRIKEILEEDEGRAASILTTLPKLQLLMLLGLTRLKKVGLPVSRVPNLECIDIVGCEEIEEMFKEEGRANSVITTLPKLYHLRLQELPRLRMVGLSVSGVPNLEVIDIRSCGEIEEIFKVEGIDPVTTLPKLKYLVLEDLPRVKSGSKATIISNSIEYIIIWKCPRLMKKLPLQMDVPLPPSLQLIMVEKEWWESLEWDINITNINPNPSLFSSNASLHSTTGRLIGLKIIIQGVFSLSDGENEDRKVLLSYNAVPLALLYVDIFTPNS